MAETNYPDVITIDEAAAYLRVHPQTIRRRVKDGTLPGARASAEPGPCEELTLTVF